jgi:hypothetical protein
MRAGDVVCVRADRDLGIELLDHIAALGHRLDRIVLVVADREQRVRKRRHVDRVLADGDRHRPPEPVVMLTSVRQPSARR